MYAFVSAWSKENDMSVESLIMLTVSVLTGVYLLYALLRPEKF